MKREHEVKTAQRLKVDLPEKGSRPHADIAEKWRQIKTLRNLDVERLRESADTKIITE